MIRINQYTIVALLSGFLLLAGLFSSANALATPPTTHAAQAIQGTVLENGKPVAGAVVRLGYSAKFEKEKGAKKAGEAKTQVLSETTANADGQFTFPGVDPGNYVVMAAVRKEKERGRQIINVKPGQNTNVEINLQPAGTPKAATQPARVKGKKKFAQ